jgi:magnesium chelatase family protein
MAERGGNESTAVIAARVLRARERAVARLAGTPWRTNGDVPPTILSQRWPIPRPALEAAGKAMDRGLLTARGFGRVQRLAWTLADLQDRDVPHAGDVAAALGLRIGSYWGEGLAA